VAVFHIYADASGKLTGKSDYTSFCGYVAHVSEWSRFQLEWDNCRFRWQVPPVHMSAIMSPERDMEWSKVKAKWGDDWEAKRDFMLSDFAATIRSAQVACVGAVVDAAHFRTLADADPDFKSFYKDTMYMSLHTLIMRGIEKTEILRSAS
jgi:hypothetical protein